jgi:hypothetical protein
MKMVLVSMRRVSKCEQIGFIGLGGVPTIHGGGVPKPEFKLVLGRVVCQPFKEGQSVNQNSNSYGEGDAHSQREGYEPEELLA